MARIIGTTIHGEDFTDLEHLIALVSANGSVERAGAEKALSVRMPIELAAKIKGMAIHGNVSQNELAVNLLDFACNAVFEQLLHTSPETRIEIFKQVSKELGVLATELGAK